MEEKLCGKNLRYRAEKHIIRDEIWGLENKGDYEKRKIKKHSCSHFYCISVLQVNTWLLEKDGINQIQEFFK